VSYVSNSVIRKEEKSTVLPPPLVVNAFGCGLMFILLSVALLFTTARSTRQKGRGRHEAIKGE
jgi:hypothetical protein